MNAVSRPRMNATVVLIAGILGVAVVFSLAASITAIRGADPELPDDYHWEGAQFERDVALARHASDLEVRARVQIESTQGFCRVLLESRGPPPAALTLAFVHGTDAQLDRRSRLLPTRRGYEGACGGLTGTHYHLELADDPGTWRIRQEIGAPRGVLELSAPRPSG